MICRGLLLSCCYAEFSSTSWHLVTIRVLSALSEVIEKADVTERVLGHQPKLICIDLVT